MAGEETVRRPSSAPLLKGAPEEVFDLGRALRFLGAAQVRNQNIDPCIARRFVWAGNFTEQRHDSVRLGRRQP
jgi:hypothetical protein